MTTSPLGTRLPVRSAAVAHPAHRRPPADMHRLAQRVRRGAEQLSTFEKVILANSAIIVLATLGGWWVTQHNPETYHYLIDTLFIALTALTGVGVNFLLLRAAFAPLNNVLSTIRAVEQGEEDARADETAATADVALLAHAFNAMLDHLAAQRDDDTKRILHAQEEERRRLALELHDQTGQSLTALALYAEALTQALATVHREPGNSAQRVQRQAERLGALAQQTLLDVQGIVRQLRPSVLDDLGLAAALRWLATDARERFGIEATARTDPPAGAALCQDRLPDELETALFRIAQESLTNAIRHGQARRIVVRLRVTSRQVQLTVRDDGIGFSQATRHIGSERHDVLRVGGLGIAGMAERARLLGGSLTIRSQPGRGCVVRVRVPAPLFAQTRGHEASSNEAEDNDLNEDKRRREQ